MGPVFSAFFYLRAGTYSAGAVVGVGVNRVERSEPWFARVPYDTNSGNYAGFKGAAGIGKTIAATQSTFIPAGLIRTVENISVPLSFLYSPALRADKSLASTAVTPWRVAGSFVAAGRTPRFNQPDGPGLVRRTLAVTFTGASTTVNATAHPFVVNDEIIFSNTGGALPAAINNTTLYRVLSATADAFTIGLSIGGAAITFATAGTGTHAAGVMRSYFAGLNIMTQSLRRGIDATGSTSLTVGADYVL
jgi:hypothetical protein